MTEKKGKTPRCKSCGEWVDKSLNEFTKNYKGYYHSNCYEAIQIENQYRIELNEYISEIYNIEFPTGWMMKQIKEYKEKRNYTYKGMELTLRYMYEVERLNKLEASDAGLGMIPYYYEKTKKYYSNLETVSSAAKDFELNNEAEIIYMQPPVRKKNKRLLDMNSI